MSLKLKYILFIALLHSALLVLIYFVFAKDKHYFIACEILVLISLLFSVHIYRSFTKPFEMLQSGTDAIKAADFTIKYLKTGLPEIDKLVEVYNEMIDRLRRERTLLTEQSYFMQKLIDVTPIGILIMDYDGKIAEINPAAQQILNVRANVKGQLLSELNNPLVIEALKMNDGERRIISVSGSTRYKCQTNNIVHQGFKRKFILIDDLSLDFLKSEKEAYGRIIRMMAHEVNNSMGAINSILDTVIEFGFENNEDEIYTESLRTARDRNLGLAKFVDNYASILRLPKPHFQKTDLASLLKRTGQLFVPQAAEKEIEIIFEVPNYMVVINADPILLEQAVSNIIKNAIESIGSKGQVKVICQAEASAFIISDNGEGITKENQQNIFKPFFSTKQTGQGVGLMLIREILLMHKAQFELKTNQETGWTNFRVVFNKKAKS